MKTAKPRPAAALFLLAALGAAPPAQAATDDAAATLCRTNPAYSLAVLSAVLNAQLAKDHDAALDAEPPDQMAAEAVEQGVGDCATELRRDPALFQTLVVLRGTDMQIGWDAFNTACDDHKTSKAACVKAEVGSVQALKRMAVTDKPPGSTALVQTCELVMQSDPPMAEWRVCVDQSLALHATPEAAARCKTAVTWHVAKTGADAAHIIAACLKRG